jgi:hypothetical protein
MARESDKEREDRLIRETVEQMNRDEEARRRRSSIGTGGKGGRGRGRGRGGAGVGGRKGRKSDGDSSMSDDPASSDEKYDLDAEPVRRIEEKADDEAKKKGLTFKQKNELVLKLKVEGLLKRAGFKQFNKDTLADLIRLDESNPELMKKYGLTLDKIEQYQRKYSPEEPMMKYSTEGPIIQKSLALRRGGNILVNRSVNRRSKMM